MKKLIPDYLPQNTNDMETFKTLLAFAGALCFVCLFVLAVYILICYWSDMRHKRPAPKQYPKAYKPVKHFADLNQINNN